MLSPTQAWIPDPSRSRSWSPVWLLLSVEFGSSSPTEISPAMSLDPLLGPSHPTSYQTFSPGSMSSSPVPQPCLLAQARNCLLPYTTPCICKVRRTLSQGSPATAELCPHGHRLLQAWTDPRSANTNVDCWYLFLVDPLARFGLVFFLPFESQNANIVFAIGKPSISVISLGCVTSPVWQHKKAAMIS